MVEVAQDVSSYCMIGLSWLFFASLHFLLFAWSRGVYPWMICGLQIWCLIGKKYSDRGSRRCVFVDDLRTWFASAPRCLFGKDGLPMS